MHRAWLAFKRRWGIRTEKHRPTKYEPRHAEIGRKLVALGANDFEIAQAFGVEAKTITDWKLKHAAFAEAMRYRDEDGTFQNDRVKRSVLHRATGYTYHSEKVFVTDGRVTRVPVVEHVPPSENAARFWLQNRAPREWNAAQNVNVNAAGYVDIKITKGMDPRDAMEAFMQMLRTPASALRAAAPLVIEGAIEHEPDPVEPPASDATGD